MSSTPETTTTEKKAERRLVDLQVSNVDLVDDAANETTFSVVKRKEGRGMAAKKSKVQKSEEETVATEVAGDESTSGGETTEESTEETTEESTEESAEDGGSETVGNDGGDPQAAILNGVSKTAEAVTQLGERLDQFLKAMSGKKDKTKKEDEEDDSEGVEKQTGGDMVKMIKDHLAAALKVTDLPADAKTEIDAAIAVLGKMGTYPDAKSKDGEEVTKAGRVFSAKNLKTMKTAFEALDSLIKMVESEAEDTTKGKTKKTEDEDGDEKVTKAVDGADQVTKAVKGLTAVVEKVTKRLDDVEGLVGVSKSLGDDEDGDDNSTVQESGTWDSLGLIPDEFTGQK